MYNELKVLSHSVQVEGQRFNRTVGVISYGSRDPKTILVQYFFRISSNFEVTQLSNYKVGTNKGKVAIIQEVTATSPHRGNIYIRGIVYSEPISSLL